MDDIDTKQKLFDALRSFDSVMVGTVADGGAIHARPMSVAEIDSAGIVWFVTSDDSPKVDEIRHDQRGVVTAQKGSLHVSMTGRYDIVRDEERIHALWKPTWKVWFPDGPEDESLVLVRFDPELGEYWDQGGIKGLRYVFAAAKALVNGDRPGVDASQHAKVPVR